MKNALKFLSGSAATYFLMAACADAPKRAHSTAAGGSPPMLARGGTTSAGGTTSPGDADDAGWGGTTGMLADNAGMFGIVNPVPDASAEPASDGSRLKAIYVVGSDGSRQQQYNWWDSKRNEECGFTAFQDGTLRCVPSASAAASSYFSDSGCSKPLYLATASACADQEQASTAYVWDGLSTACGVAAYSRILRVSAVDPPRVYAGTSTTCSDVTTSAKPAKPLYVFFIGADEVPLSSFVSATKEHG